MAVRLWVPGVLREFTGGSARVEMDVAPPVTVGRVLDRVDADLPALGRRIRDERGVVRAHVNVFVGSTNIRDAELLDTPVPDGVEISILPATSGG